MKVDNHFSRFTLDKLFIILIITALLSGCSATKFVGESNYLLKSATIKSDNKDVDVALLAPYIRQKANSKWFSVLKIPMSTYALSGRDSTKWINKILQRIGERPVVFDTIEARKSCEDLNKAMNNMGYMHSSVNLSVKKKKKKVDLIYYIHPGEPLVIRNIHYTIDDSTIALIIKRHDKNTDGLKTGTRFNIETLNNERKRITDILLDSGYYRFHRDFIQYEADSIAGTRNIDLTLHIMKYLTNDKTQETNHPRYKIRNVNFLSGDNDEKIHLRNSVYHNSTAIAPGDWYNYSDLQKTYNRFSRLHAVSFTNIKFNEVPDTALVDCNIQLSTRKPNTISFQPEGTNTAGDLGAAASVTFTNHNLFRGSETFSLQLRGAFEAITGLEGYKDQDYQEYNLESSLSFPRFVAPFISRSFKRKSTASSDLSLSYNLQNRPEFHRRVFSAAWRYRWSEPRHHSTYRFDLIDLNYVYMPWISQTFKKEYLDSVDNRNVILRYNYEDLFIMKTGLQVTYSGAYNVMRANFETAGNVLSAISSITGNKKNDNGQHSLFNIAYAQYVKGDIDYTHLISFDSKNTLALHSGFGIAFPYGNSKVLPFEKRYFSGGANSLRGWTVRGIGPGKYRGKDGKIDFINQTGDMKLDLNAELRSFLFWKLSCAVFVDAGNIWTLRAYDDQPGGQFKFNEFYKQIAVSYGLGLRFSFDYFILRFDGGMRAIDPSYETNEEHYAIFHPKFSRDFAFHFAVGLPF
jgi:outer membrane protein assembly factor BamA